MYCRAQLGELQEDYETITGLDAEILAVSVDDLSSAARVVDFLGVEFEILSDAGAETIRDYGIYIERTMLPAPSTFIVDKMGNIRWQFIGNDLRDRPANEEIIAQLRALG